MIRGNEVFIRMCERKMQRRGKSGQRKSEVEMNEREETLAKEGKRNKREKEKGERGERERGGPKARGDLRHIASGPAARKFGEASLPVDRPHSLPSQFPHTRTLSAWLFRRGRSIRTRLHR